MIYTGKMENTRRTKRGGDTDNVCVSSLRPMWFTCNVPAILLFIVALLTLSMPGRSQYISGVLEYQPAPGQLINTVPWGVPSSAGTLTGGINGSLSLGAFGGYVVFEFDGPVENHPGNPFGIDFTIFGNPSPIWSEPGVVSVMKDENGNGLPDDTWYELAGSDHHFSSTVKNYIVTYQNPGMAADVHWVDNLGGEGYIFANALHSQPYYPLQDSFPSIGAEIHALAGTLLEAFVDSTDQVFVKSPARSFGYADNRVRRSAPWTVPDNPYTSRVENSGGDAFDISWAIDSEGNYVDLEVIHFVKVQNGYMAHGGWLGELSTELTGAADVEPDITITGETRMLVIKDLPPELNATTLQLEVFAFESGRLLDDAEISWETSLPGSFIDGNDMLTVTESGDLQLIAYLLSDPVIADTVFTVVDLSSAAGEHTAGDRDISIVPNPADGQFRLSGAENCSVVIYDAKGREVYSLNEYSRGKAIPAGSFQPGLYLVRIKAPGAFHTMKLIKR